ncbi:MAG: hypothetical protein CL398_02520 [Acidiferrobacteraceae bacterium]|nr:hypothetical protein [Acidiferrobacteraceae bacterium]|tara:strand:+ start:1266 stop:1874 length:609 start_codon:yes stop_codon:yes gene_type:complete
MNFRDQLSVKPWVAQRGLVPSSRGFSAATPKVTLGVFLCIASVLFGLFIAAYFIRMGYADWQSIPVPALLWLNTVILIASSIALQWASVSARRENPEGVKLGLYVGGGCTLVFFVGQWLAWQQLQELGYFVYSNPSNGFFYMLTTVHALHLFGGLVAWVRATSRVHRSKEIALSRMILELCAIYWHFLLLVWLVLFGLLLAT